MNRTSSSPGEPAVVYEEESVVAQLFLKGVANPLLAGPSVSVRAAQVPGAIVRRATWPEAFSDASPVRVFAEQNNIRPCGQLLPGKVSFVYHRNGTRLRGTWSGAPGLDERKSQSLYIQPYGECRSDGRDRLEADRGPGQAADLNWQ